MELKINSSLSQNVESIGGASSFGSIVSKNTGDYLPSSGGTITGNIDYKTSFIDASAANNGVSSMQYPTVMNFTDTGNRIYNRFESRINPNGKIGSYWYVRNYNTSGTMVAQKGIAMDMDKSGNLTYDVADPANFRSAIDVAQKGNYGFYKWTGSVVLDSTTSPIYKELSITTHGRPVFIIVTGDNNPTSETCWFNIKFYRNGTMISSQIVESHGASWNIPFAMQYLDTVAAGTYTYKVEFSIGTGSSQLNESGDKQSPNFTIFEI